MKYLSMRHLTAVFSITLGIVSSFVSWADNPENCEVVLMEEIAQEDREGTTKIASFRPADNFLESVYDDNIAVIRKIDDLPIRTVMCQRKDIIPTLRDFSILATGIPLTLSQNFDSTTSGLTTIYFKNGRFHYTYKGPDLSEDKIVEMIDRLEVYNLQPHELTQREKTMRRKKEK